MKSTINNKTYDTDKAVLIAEASNYGGNDFRAWRERLYRTPKGNWFLHGWGGALSEYADRYLKGASEGERIIPMSKEDAYAWCEKHHSEEAIEQNFKDMTEEA